MITIERPSDETERSSSILLMVLTESSIFFGRCPGVIHRNGNRRNIDLREQIHSETEVRKYADHDE
jgi:hypothetical protein